MPQHVAQKSRSFLTLPRGIRDMIFGRAPEKAQQFAQKPCAPERSQSLDQEPCYFLTLSREIRDMIYGYILVNEHTIEPYTPFPEDKRKPLEPKIASLLRTNKLISAEARQMLYGKNHWPIPVVDTLKSNTIFHRYPKLFKHVTLAFDQRDLGPSQRLDATRRAHSRVPNARIKDIDAYHVRTAHSMLGREMQIIWFNAWRLLKLHLPYVKTITLDLENFACPGGCCRLKMCKRNARFQTGFLAMLKEKEFEKQLGVGVMKPKVYVKGLLNEEERDLFYEKLGFLEAPFHEVDHGGYRGKIKHYHW